MRLCSTDGALADATAFDGRAMTIAAYRQHAGVYDARLERVRVLDFGGVRRVMDTRVDAFKELVNGLAKALL